MCVSGGSLVAGVPWVREEAAGWRDGEAIQGAESWAVWRRRVRWGQGGRGPGPEGVGLRDSEQKVDEVPGDEVRMTD